MRSRLVAGASAALLVVIAMWLLRPYVLGSNSDVSADRDRAQDRRPGGPATRTALPSLHESTLERTSATEDRDRPSGMARLPSPPPENVVQLDDARARLREAAKPCYVPHPSLAKPGQRDETMQSVNLQFLVVVRDGHGHLETVRVVRSDLADKALENCIVDKLGETSWESELPNTRLTVRDELSVAELKAMYPPEVVPPPSPSP